MSTVLLVDDNPADRALFRVLLGREGYDVHEIVYGKETVEKARNLRPHLIVLDVNLPDIDGHQVCRALKSDPGTAGIPVLILTVRQRESDVISGLEAGADDYVAKDEPAQIILARIQRLVRYRQMAQSALLNEQLAQIGRLLAGIVHEIRGPLSVLRGHAELLQVLTAGNEEINEWVEPILRNAKLLQVRLTHLMAAVRAGSNRKEPVDLVALIKEAVELFLRGGSLHQNRPTVRVEVEDDLNEFFVEVDAGKLLLVLLNLLNNADEAFQSVGQTECQIKIQLRSCLEHGTEEARLDILDNGPGIPASVMDRIFEPFFTTKVDGSGYGLYLSYQILEEMGGRLKVCNQPGGGACFSLSMPRQTSPLPL